MVAVFFDLDGTLTDPKPGIVGSIRYALDKMKIDNQPDDLDWCIGPPLQESFAKLVGEDRAEEGVAAYRERFSKEGLFENSVFDGIAEMLEGLKVRGFPLYVATSKPHVFANPILEHFELASYFDRVFGSELDGTRGNKAELLAYALTETGESAMQSVMIGDRKHDIIGAVKNDMKSIGVLWGYGSREELVEAGAGQIAGQIADLGKLIG